jgi:hypothetical protein
LAFSSPALAETQAAITIHDKGCKKPRNLNQPYPKTDTDMVNTFIRNM